MIRWLVRGRETSPLVVALTALPLVAVASVALLSPRTPSPAREHLDNESTDRLRSLLTSVEPEQALVRLEALSEVERDRLAGGGVNEWALREAVVRRVERRAEQLRGMGRPAEAARLDALAVRARTAPQPLERGDRALALEP